MRGAALAFGVPPMLLGIPGDNTYANYQEANRAFYRLTVLPLVARIAGCHAASRQELQKMSDLSNATLLWVAKAVGAVAGSAISLAYILPHGRREAACRFAVGVVCGLVFGGTAGLKIAAELGIDGAIGPNELMLMGSAAASLCAWWALGFVMRAFEDNGFSRILRDKKKEDADGR